MKAQTLKEIKKTARENGININSCRQVNGGYAVKYYAFNNDGNYKTEEKETFFDSVNALKAFAEQIS